MGTDKTYYTVAETADLANVSTTYIHNLITGGTIKAIKEPAHGHGGFKYQIDAKEVDRLLEARNGAIEAAKGPNSNVYIDRKELAKLTGRSVDQVKTDDKIGNLTATRITAPSRRGFKYGYSVAEVKKYMRFLENSAPKFVTAEEMKELLG